MTSTAANAPKWAWLSTSLLFLLAALVFQRIAVLADGWFNSLGAFAFVGLLFDMALVFLAAFVTAGLFMRRYGFEAPVRRKLAIAYTIAFAIWNVLSFLLIANMLKFAPVTLGLGGFALAEVLVGAAGVSGAVLVRGRLFERKRARGAVLGGVS